MSWLIGLYILWNADNLEEFGIFRGASAPMDDDHEMTDDEKRAKIQSLMGILPDDMRELFKETLRETDPVRSAQKYYQEVQREEMRQNIAMGKPLQEPDIGLMGNDANEMMWMEMERNIFDSNHQQEDQYNDFNVNDWID